MDWVVFLDGMEGGCGGGGPCLTLALSLKRSGRVVGRVEVALLGLGDGRTRRGTFVGRIGHTLNLNQVSFLWQRSFSMLLVIWKYDQILIIVDSKTFYGNREVR